MADDPGNADNCRASDLELLRSGNFADVEIVCGDRSWNCHRGTLTSRSTWFRKALAGPFQEASNRRVNLDEENPMCVDLALKYIYGGGLVIESSVSEEHFAELCVLLWRCADFLLLYKLKMSVEKAVRSYCDKRLKQLCTWNSATKVHDPDRQNTLSPWGLDLVLGVKRAYDLKVEDLKAVFMEFIWIGRMWTFRNGNAAALRNHLSDTPAFMDDLLAKYASGPWMKTAVWAPEHKDCYTQEDQCRTCTKKISWSEKSEGQVLDPFTVDYNRFKFIRGWCRACSEGDKIPWRG